MIDIKTAQIVVVNVMMESRQVAKTQSFSFPLGDFAAWREYIFFHHHLDHYKKQPKWANTTGKNTPLCLS
ncbi:MAG: hypothetical protein R3A44_38260 [Caldilineaceae bacterium]